MTNATDRKQGLIGELGIKKPVRVATTANITLSGLQTIDGVTVVEDDRVLVKNQTTASENGIYDASSGSWTRSLDFDGNQDVTDGTIIYVRAGTTQLNQFWAVSATNPITIGTTSISFIYAISFGDAGLVAANNLSDVPNKATARDNMGLEIGVDIQAYDADLATLAGLSSIANLTALAGLTGAADKVPYFTGVGTLALSDLLMGRNAIINGDFNIWQRGTSFSSMADGTYTADRWIYAKSGAMVHDITQSTDVPTVAEAGRKFNYSLKIDCTTVDSSIASSDFAVIEHRVEGYNWLPLAQKAGIISFWVKATKIGIYGVYLKNSTSDRSYISEITINASDTWEKKTVNYSASPAAGTWDYTRGIGIALGLTLASGSTYHTTKDVWQTGGFLSTSSQVNACDSTSNDLYICGVQLEEGSVATPFENRTIQEELALCQRYYEKSYDIGTAIGTATTTGANSLRASGATADGRIEFKVSKRNTPTVTIYNPSTGTVGQFRNESTSANVAVTAELASENGAMIRTATVADTNRITWHYTATSEL